MTNMDNKKYGWWCPLLNKEITEGYCLDINNERLGFFKTGSLDQVKSITQKTLEEINSICDKCPNFPL